MVLPEYFTDEEWSRIMKEFPPETPIEVVQVAVQEWRADESQEDHREDDA